MAKQPYMPLRLNMPMSTSLLICSLVACERTVPKNRPNYHRLSYAVRWSNSKGKKTYMHTDARHKAGVDKAENVETHTRDKFAVGKNVGNKAGDL